MTQWSSGRVLALLSRRRGPDPVPPPILYIYRVPTMPAKSLGTLAMIYAIVELQNPLPRKTMLWKGDMNISASTSDTFLQR